MIFPAIFKGSYIERMSDEEFFRFCQDNRDLKFERTSEGQIEVMSPTFFRTGDQNSEIITQLRNWNKKYKLGRVVDSDTGFYLANNAMRNPDCAWVSNKQLEKLDPIELRGFPHLCPDFVIELKSESDRIVDLKKKMQEWMANGCRLGWLIDADAEIVYVFDGQNERTHNGFDTLLSGEPVLPGFEMILSELRV
jgi:Uma2 family endonuclease